MFDDYNLVRIFLNFFLEIATQAKATAEMVVAVDVTSDVTVKNVTNVIKWDILHANAKKMLIDATDAMVIYCPFSFIFHFHTNSTYFFFHL